MSTKELKRPLPVAQDGTDLPAAPARRGFLRLTAAGFGSAVLGGGLLSACGGGGTDGGAAGRESPQTGQHNGSPGKCPVTSWNLTAGQHQIVGIVSVTNDATNLYVSYTLTDEDCTFGKLHAWVGTDLASLPKNRGGNPVPGQFPYKHDASGSTRHTFTIPLASLGITDLENACEKVKLYVVTHAEVDCKGTNETAFGGNQPVNVGTPGRWWFYGEYTPCCPEDGDDGKAEVCETAFAKGTHVFTTGGDSNPENLPSLGLSQNRWGWAILLTASGNSQYDIWAAAGKNDTSKGHKVGTLSVQWNGTTARVTYTLTDPDCKLQEVHLYAADARPSTLAPGQYGHTADLSATHPATHTFEVSLRDAGSDGVWLIAHAVVCCKAQS